MSFYERRFLLKKKLRQNRSKLWSLPRSNTHTHTSSHPHTLTSKLKWFSLFSSKRVLPLINLWYRTLRSLIRIPYNEWPHGSWYRYTGSGRVCWGRDRKEQELKFPSSWYSLVDVYYWIRGKDIPYKIKYSRLSVWTLKYRFNRVWSSYFMNIIEV